MRRLLSDLELGARERERRRCVIAARLSPALATEVERRAKAAGVTKSRFITEIVTRALRPNAKGVRP